MNKTQLPRLTLVAGPFVALLVGASTSSVRDQVGASNVGIALAIIVAVAALISRGAGLATAATAALTFNFFHTQPYHSLRIHAARDVVIVGLLAALGVIVSDISSWRRRRAVLGDRSTTARKAPATIGRLVATAQPVTQVWPQVVGTIMDQLSLADCRFQVTLPHDLSLISRSATRGSAGEDDFVLPSSGAAVAVIGSGGAALGYLVLSPRDGHTSLRVERRVVVALADHLAIALSYGDHLGAEGGLHAGSR